VTARRFAALLVAAAAWTVTIKFILPVAAALRAGEPAGTHVMWDFWWVAHLALAWSLTRPAAATWQFAAVVAWAEIAIITAKFARFLAAPAWTFWTANWFVNKCAVLTLFLAMAWWLHRGDGRALRDRMP